MLSTFLNISGHEPIGALSVSQTWDKLAYEVPDAFLLDMMLPDGNGLDICRELRADPRWASAPILIISAHTPPMTSEATAAGADGYLVKPIKLDVLRSALRDIGIT